MTGGNSKSGYRERGTWCSCGGSHFFYFGVVGVAGWRGVGSSRGYWVLRWDLRGVKKPASRRVLNRCIAG